MRIKIFHAPGSCSRVSLSALEEIGVTYEDQGVALMRGEQKQPAFLSINPKGKVPVVMIDGQAVTETPVILQTLADAYPQAALMPMAGGAEARARWLSDLVWCAGALHPLSHRLFRPDAYTEGNPSAVKAVALKQMAEAAAEIERRLQDGAWWYGADWSIVDVYVAWVVATASQFGFPIGDYPTVEAHSRRVRDRSSFQRALQREREAVARDHLSLPPGLAL